jgi:hypothetical protein
MDYQYKYKYLLIKPHIYLYYGESVKPLAFYFHADPIDFIAFAAVSTPNQWRPSITRHTYYQGVNGFTAGWTFHSVSLPHVVQ